MVIGYGFRDEHINEQIVKAATQGDLQFFVINPCGARIVQEVNLSKGMAKEPLDHAFEAGLAGASQRSLSEIFTDDKVAQDNVVQLIA